MVLLVIKLFAILLVKMEVFVNHQMNAIVPEQTELVPTVTNIFVILLVLMVFVILITLVIVELRDIMELFVIIHYAIQRAKEVVGVLLLTDVIVPTLEDMVVPIVTILFVYLHANTEGNVLIPMSAIAMEQVTMEVPVRF